MSYASSALGVTARFCGLGCAPVQTGSSHRVGRAFVRSINGHPDGGLCQWSWQVLRARVSGFRQLMAGVAASRVCTTS